MTFVTNVPNAAQSPGLFPAQNNTNNGVLKNIIDRDHFFNDTPAPNDNSGTHRQVTMTARTPPIALPDGTNSILYTFLDDDGLAQLAFFNDDTDISLTPPQDFYPMRIVGSQSVSGGSTVTAYANPGFRYAGTGWCLIKNSEDSKFFNILRAGSNVCNELDNDGSSDRPDMFFSGNDLEIKNQASGTETLVWSLIINRIP